MNVVHDFKEPKDSPLILELAKLFFPLIMRLKHGRFSIRIVGDGLKNLKRLKKKRVVICPNHPSEDDAEVVFGLSRLTGESFYFLTAHEIFHGHHGWNGAILPHLGCYAICRGVQDLEAYRITKKLLVKNKRKLIAFPEGEVSHFNEIVMPLERGVVQMAFSALDDLDRLKKRDSIFILPVAIKYLFSENALEHFDQSLATIEDVLGIQSQTIDAKRSGGNGGSHEKPSDVELRTLAARTRAALMKFISNLEDRHKLPEELALPFAERMSRLRSAIVEDVAERLSIDLQESSSQIGSAHALKTILCDKFFHGQRNHDTEYDTATLKALYKELLCAIHLIAVENSFVSRSEPPDQEEIGEMIELLVAALHLKHGLLSRKIVLIDIGKPIDLRDYQEEYKVDKNTVVHDINRIIRIDLLSMIATLSHSPTLGRRAVKRLSPESELVGGHP